MAMQILLVEDSLEVQTLIKGILGNRYEIQIASTAVEADRLARSRNFDLILLDVMLPDGDGFQICSRFQNDETLRNVPVIFLTAKDSVDDIIMGYKLGADDYIVKPFEPRIFRAKIEGKLQKSTHQAEGAKWLKREGLHLNLHSQRAYLVEGENQKQIDLTPTEFRLLYTLIMSEEQILSREQLLDRVWTQETHVTDRVVDIHISSLRKKLLHLGHYIRTVYGTGYSFSQVDR